MGRIVIPRPRFRSSGYRPRQRLRAPRRELTMKEKYGVSQYELFRLGLDAAIGLGGRAAASSETARRRRQRAALAEGAESEMRAGPTAFLAKEPVETPTGVEDARVVGADRVGRIMAGGAPGAPEDRDRWEEARQDVIREAESSRWGREAPDLMRGWTVQRHGGPPDADPFQPGMFGGMPPTEPVPPTYAGTFDPDPGGELASARSEKWMGLEEAGPISSFDTLPPTRLTGAPPPAAPAAPVALPTRTPSSAAPYIPTTLGEAQAMARFATTQEEMAVAMEHIDQLARAGSLGDAITGAHIRRAQEAALKGWRPPRGETARDRAQLAYIMQRTEASRASAALTRERIAALRARSAKDVEKGKRVVGAIRRSDRPSAVGDAYEAAVTWTEEYEDFDKKTGEWSDDAILEEIRIVDPAAAEHATPEMIDTRRNSKWRSKTGQFANKTPDTIAAAVQRSMPKRRDQKLAQEAKRMVGNVGARYKASAKAASSLETTEAREGIKNSAREAILRFKATLPTTGERTGATSRRGQINLKLASARADLVAATRPDAKVYYEEYIRNLEGLLTQPVAAPVSAAPTTPQGLPSPSGAVYVLDPVSGELVLQQP